MTLSTNQNTRSLRPTESAPIAVVGAERKVRLATGMESKVVSLNNAATTPIFQNTLDALHNFYQSYGALHRGAGPNARRTCELIEQAESTIRRFIGATAEHALLFTANTSEALNVVARLLTPITANRCIVTSDIEHTSNNLPWRFHSQAKILEVRSDRSGKIDLTHFEELLRQNQGKVALVTLTGASNLTGYIPPIKKLAELAKQSGALVCIDGAQLVPHRPINMQSYGIDIFAFSAHKIYAPAGIGVLALPKKLLNQIPKSIGGGSIDMYNSQGGLVWAPALHRHQIGSTNSAGIFALGTSIGNLNACGWDQITLREDALVKKLVQRLSQIEGIRMLGEAAAYLHEGRTGAVPFIIEGQHHALTAAILEAEHGIEVRAGTICNHRLVRRWFSIDDANQAAIEAEISKGNRLASYGVVRASLGVHNQETDIEDLALALEAMIRNGPALQYRALPTEERFEPIA